MFTARPFPRPARQGYALLLTLLFLTVSLLVLASLGRWTYSESRVNARNIAFNSSVAAAEAATEVTIAQMGRDFLHQSLSTNAATYNRVLPGTFVANGWTSDYQFSDGQGHANQTGIQCLGWQQWSNLDSTYAGLHGMINTYQITSNARKTAGLYPVTAGVRQTVQFTAIPIFQFAIFSSMDLEINPGAPMVVTGRTHGNANIYIAPSSTLAFMDTVSYVGNILYNRAFNDPTPAGKNMPQFDGAPQQEQVSALTLPVSTDNNPTNVVQILDAPPAGESPLSGMGTQRLFNHADLVIVTRDNSVSVQFNDYEDGTSFTTVATNAVAGGTNSGYSFINTNASFYDYREGKQIVGTEIDIQALTNWLASSSGYNFNLLDQSRLNHQLNSIYVDDQRSIAGKLTAVRVVNGRQLPPNGLTIASPRPLYVKGNYNAPDLTVGLTNTVNTKPASLIADSITILSGNWSDNYSSSTTLASRSAVNTSVNAAFMAGMVSSATVNGVAHYSGGVENFPRFLENWTGSALTYNGSMVMMFPSRYATNFWINPGTYYNPPTRDWAFDCNFLDMNKLPPETPQVRTLQRGAWQVVAANQ